jgi:hypothetical protein
MKKRVLLAIDLDQPATWAASYAVQLAGRLELGLVLAAVFPPLPAGARDDGEATLEGLNEEQRLWLGKVRERCQQEGVEMEIFISSGPFCEEVLRFAQAQSCLRFVIMGTSGRGESLTCSDALKTLQEQFAGEVLLVRGQGKIIRLEDL